MNRRSAFALASAATAMTLAACASTSQPSTGGGGTDTGVPTVARIKAAYDVFVAELPTVRAVLAQNKVSADNLQRFDTSAGTLQALKPSVDGLSEGMNATDVLTKVQAAVIAAMASIPASSQYVPIAIVLSAMIAAYMAGAPVLTSMPAPAEVHRAAAAPLHRH